MLAWDVEEKLSLVLDNFFEFEAELLKLAEEVVIWGGHEFIDTMQRRLLLDRRLINVLSACRLYLDQTDHVISNIFGNPSSELSGIKQFKNKLYDEHFGYRLMETLRNHAQHAGLVVHGISHNFHHHYRNEGGKRVLEGAKTECAVIPECNVSILAQDSDFKVSVLKEAEAIGKNLDLRRPLREYVSCITIVHREIRNLINPRAEAARTSYEQALRDFEQNECKSLLFPTLEKTDGAAVIARVPLVSDFFEAWDALLKKNPVLNNLQWEFASNQTSK